jgi:hypothetical protein
MGKREKNETMNYLNVEEMIKFVKKFVKLLNWLNCKIRNSLSLKYLCRNVN